MKSVPFNGTECYKRGLQIEACLQRLPDMPIFTVFSCFSENPATGGNPIISRSPPSRRVAEWPPFGLIPDPPKVPAFLNHTRILANTACKMAGMSEITGNNCQLPLPGVQDRTHFTPK